MNINQLASILFLVVSVVLMGVVLGNSQAQESGATSLKKRSINLPLSVGLGDEDEYDMEKRGGLFRFGKRGGLFRFGKRGTLLRFGKRGRTLFRFGRSGNDDTWVPSDNSYDNVNDDDKRTFHWGREIHE